MRRLNLEPWRPWAMLVYDFVDDGVYGIPSLRKAYAKAKRYKDAAVFAKSELFGIKEFQPTSSSPYIQV